MGVACATVAGFFLASACQNLTFRSAALLPSSYLCIYVHVYSLSQILSIYSLHPHVLMISSCDIAVLVALAAFAVLVQTGTSMAVKTPHVLLVVADDYGWNDVGYHQSNKTTNVPLKTPTLDRLASEGRKLERYYVQPLCSPTRGTILTGKSQSFLAPCRVLIKRATDTTQRNNIPNGQEDTLRTPVLAQTSFVLLTLMECLAQNSCSRRGCGTLATQRTQ